MKNLKYFFISFVSIGFLAILFFFYLENKNTLFPPITVSVSSKYPQELYLVAGGDIMLSRTIGYLSKKEGYGRMFSGENYHPLKQFSCFGQKNCLLFFNLESMFSAQDNDVSQPTFIFKSNTGNLQTLLDLKKEHQLFLSLANNHVHNAGGAGVALTRSLLEANGISFFGAGNTQEEAESFFLYQQGDIRLCFQAYSYDGASNIYGGKQIVWNALEKKRILEDLEIMKERACDAKILVLHWGAEYRIAPNKTQITLAHELVDAGADLILGGHSHVPGKYEIYKGTPIFYSLGNFIFDQDWGMRTIQKGFDYIYDHELGKKTVPTYLSLLVGIKFIKTDVDFSVSIDQLALARMVKGFFSTVDEKTKTDLLKELVF